MNQRLCLSFALVMAAIFPSIALSAPTVADSSTFAHQYNGDEIFDGTSMVNQWDVAASGGTEADLSLDGSNLIYTYTTNNGWFQHDDGGTPWEMGAGESWTVAVKAKLTSTNPDPFGRFVIWTDVDGAGENQILVAGETGVNQFGFGFDLQSDNTSDFHEYRIAYDHPNEAYYFYRDGVQVMQSSGVASGLGDGSYAARAGTSATRLIVGDCCSNVGGVGGQVEYEWIRYDMSGAFAPIPVPEPSTFVLVALAMLGCGRFVRQR